MCICILGSSGSGKTTLVKHLAKKNNKVKTYVTNSHGEYEKSEFESLDLEDLIDKKIEKCNLIFEDLIGMKARDFKMIKHFIHFLLRRRNINLFLIGHEVHNTGFFSLLPSMDFIYVSSGPKNKKNVKDLRRILELEELDSDKFLLAPYHYLEINVKEGSQRFLNNEFENAQTKEEEDKMLKRAELSRYLVCLPEGKAMLTLFDIIFKSLPASYLTNDLCLVLGHSGKIHIIDFLASLRSTDEPTKHIKNLKLYIDKQFVIPNTFIKNAKLKYQPT